MIRYVSSVLDGSYSEEAANQIIKKKYESQLKYESYANRLRYAMAFCDKKVLIVKA